MGGGRWDSRTYASYSARTNTERPRVDDLFTKRGIDPGLDPRGIKFRESRDSTANPKSNALIVALDVTGSMDRVLDSLARKGLGELIEQIYARKPIVDPHVCLMAVGDVECDQAPLQVTQFEAQVEPLTSQLEKIYLERGGGGNRYESYSFAWLFAALFTQIDCWEKRQRKGYLFTVGDELPTPRLSSQVAAKFLGRDVPGEAQEADSAAILRAVAERYHVFHLNVEEGNHSGNSPDDLRKAWGALLGQHYINLTDHAKLAEVIVSVIQMDQGAERESVMDSWKDRRTRDVVAQALLPSAGR